MPFGVFEDHHGVFDALGHQLGSVDHFGDGMQIHEEPNFYTKVLSRPRPVAA